MKMLSLFPRRTSLILTRHFCQKPLDLQQYQRMQAALTNRQRAPKGDESFRDLREFEVLAFRDITPFFQEMYVLDPSPKSITALLRGRRWGKTVLGEAWLAFLSGEAELFKGTWAEKQMRKDKFIGIKLDFKKVTHRG